MKVDELNKRIKNMNDEITKIKLRKKEVQKAHYQKLGKILVMKYNITSIKELEERLRSYEDYSSISF